MKGFWRLSVYVGKEVMQPISVFSLFIQHLASRIFYIFNCSGLKEIDMEPEFRSTISFKILSDILFTSYFLSGEMLLQRPGIFKCCYV